MQPEEQVSLPQLAAIFARVGSTAFGGGGSTLAMLHDEFCQRRPILSNDEFQVLFAIARITPGINILALTVLLGHRSHGIPGALWSLAGLTAPSFTIIILGCLLLRGEHLHPGVRGAVRGLTPAAAALLAYTSWQLCRGSLEGQTWLGRAIWALIVIGSGLLVALQGLHPAWLVLGGGLLGVVAFAAAREKGK